MDIIFEYLYRLTLFLTSAIHFMIWVATKPFENWCIKFIKQRADEFDIRIIDKWDTNNKENYGASDMDNDESKKRPTDMIVYKKEFYLRLLSEQTLGLFEAYMDGWWDCDDFTSLMDGILRTKVHHRLPLLRLMRALNYLKYFLFNLQTPGRAWQVGQQHYDLDNDMFMEMLGKNALYSCGYFKNTTDLDQAQLNKIELIAQKLKLKPGMRVLDVGCGWGQFAKYLAEKYKVSVVGITVSKEQAAFGQKLCQGLDVDIRAMDWRSIQNETFDRVTSIECIEHFGYKNYRSFFEMVNKSLVRDGIFLLQTSGVQDPDMWTTEPFSDKYIFRNGMFPRATQFVNAMEGFFVVEDWQNFGHHYTLTLNAWASNFDKYWPSYKNKHQNPERFYRMWMAYLKLAEAMFKSRQVHLWQIVMSRDGLTGGYESPR